MDRIIKILMERDGNTRREAEERIAETKAMMEDCGYDPEESEEIFMDELELDLDYLFDFLMGM